MSSTKFAYNPLSGRLNAYKPGEALTAEAASRVEINFNCEASAAIQDIVYIDDNNNEFVLVNTNNTVIRPSIGVIIAKPTSTTCTVLVLGVDTGYTGLGIGDRVYLGTSGGIQFTAPVAGYVQELGVVVAPDKIFYIPNSTRVLRT